MTNLRDKIKDIVREIEAERGPLELAALIELDDNPGQYDFVVSAPWITDEFEYYRYLSPKLHKWLSDEEWYELARSVAVPPNSDFMQDFSRFVGPVTREENIRNLRLANMDVRYAHLFPTKATNLSYVN